MAKTATTALKAHLDKILPGCAAQILAAINSTHTAFGRELRDKLAYELGGIGEATAFEAACTGNTAITSKIAIMNHLEKTLHGRGHAEELSACIADGTVT